MASFSKRMNIIQPLECRFERQNVLYFNPHLSFVVRNFSQLEEVATEIIDLKSCDIETLATVDFSVRSSVKMLLCEVLLNK